MRSAAINNLPPELLQQILSHFCLHCSSECHSNAPDAYFRGAQQEPDYPSWYSVQRHALFSLCLQSKRLQSAAQPILYHEFALGYGDSWRSKKYTWSGRLTSFMRTVACRRDLATLVRRVFIHPNLLEDISAEEASSAFEQAVHALGLDLKANTPPLSATLVNLLVAQLPSLEHLSVQYSLHSVGSTSLAVLRDALFSPLPLRTLDLSARSPGNYSPYGLFELSLGTCMIIGTATKLEALNIHMCCGFQHPTIQISLPTLKVLRLTHSRLNISELEMLLKPCVGLHTFVYEAAGPFQQNIDSHRSDDHFKPSGVVDNLRPLKQTLRSLHLDLRWRFGPGDCLPSLQDFSSLEHLFLDSGTLHGYSRHTSPSDSMLLSRLLPPSIVSVHLAVDKWKINTLPRLAKALTGLNDAVSQGQFPKLILVECNQQRRLDDQYSLGQMFSVTGVTLQHADMPLSDAVLRPRDVHPAWTFVVPCTTFQMRPETTRPPGAPAGSNIPSVAIFPDPPWQFPGYNSPLPLPDSDDDDDL